MALISLRQLLDHAAEHGYGVPAFNVNNLEQVQAIMQAAAQTDSPVILQASAGARKYAGEPFLRHLVEAAIESYPEIPIVMHQDHGASPSVCVQSIRSGFSSVMMDGSLKEDGKTPASYEYNVEVTHHVVRIAHAVGVSVEGELGCLGSLESGKAGEEDGHGAEGHLSHDMDASQMVFEIHGLILALHYEARFLKSAQSLARASLGFENILQRYGAVAEGRASVSKTAKAATGKAKKKIGRAHV